MQPSTISSWVVKGLGGVAKMVADLTDEKIPIDGDALKDLRACVVRLASHYNYHAKRSSLEPHERPAFWGGDYPIGEVSDHARLDENSTQGSAGPTGQRSDDAQAGERSSEPQPPWPTIDADNLPYGLGSI